ncbi:MAG: ATP-binding protein [Treponema sp.]|nr:ATP-binding protein [Treponema sp.]
MIVEIRAENAFVFNEKVVFSLEADMRTKKFVSNVCSFGNFNVVKVAGIYGPNNSGKTNLLRCINVISRILLNKGFFILYNLFSKSTIVSLGVSFIFEERFFSYDFKYDAGKNEYVYEMFAEIIKDSSGNEKTDIWLERDISNSKLYVKDKKMSDMLRIVARNNILIHLVNTEHFEYMREMKRILTGFAEKVDFVDMNNIPIEKTINVLKSKKSICKKMVDFIKNADLDMDDFYFNEKIKLHSNDNQKPQENVLNSQEPPEELMRLTSVYKGKKVPSLFFDSTGTKKIEALASYIIEALEHGRILIVDELDSSIHFKLARAIVALFNNELNYKAQLIFTVHDITLMDCQKLFRKEQIWFVHKDPQTVYLYSLAEFSAQDGIRDTTDLIEKYKKGVLGALPEPELINSLLKIRSGRS